MKYYFIIDCDERGEFSAHVETSNGAIVVGWTKDECADSGGFPPVVYGFMRNMSDMSGLARAVWLGRKFPPIIQKGRP